VWRSYSSQVHSDLYQDDEEEISEMVGTTRRMMKNMKKQQSSSYKFDVDMALLYNCTLFFEEWKICKRL
jgi:hypothetical protein